MAKTVWTDADFDAMSWHDNAVHAVALESAQDHPGRLLLDIGYILEGILPEPPATTLSFWICPASLVFDQAWDLTTDNNLQGWSFQLFLDAIERSGPDEHGFFECTLAGDHGRSVMIWIQVRDVRDEHARLTAAGVPVIRAPAAEPWGLIEMWIEDPDGVRIVLVEVPADHPLRRDPRSTSAPR